MRKTKISLILLSAILFFAGGMFLTSCNKEAELETTNDDENTLTVITAKNIALQHNNCILYAYSKKKKEKDGSLDDIYIMMDYFGEYLINEEGMSKNEVNQAVNIAKEKFPLYVNTIKEIGTEIQAYSTYLDLIANERGYSLELINTLKTPIEQELYNQNKDTLLAYFENVLNSNNFVNNEKVIADIYCLVAKSSYELWFGNEKSTLEGGTDVIIIDAIGALYGSPFGGVTSIIMGAAFSVAHNEEWFE